MEDFLSEEIRVQALAHVKNHLQCRPDNAGKHNTEDRDGPKYSDSPYILSNILVEESTGLKMSGTGGKNGKRKYRINKAKECPGIDLPFPKEVNAEPIEGIVVSSLSEVLENSFHYQNIIRQEIERQRRAICLAENEVSRLQTERQKLDDDCRYIHQHRDIYGEERSREYIKENNSRIAEIDHQLAIIEHQDVVWGKNVDDKVKSLTEELANTASWLKRGPNRIVRRIIELFVKEIRVNTKTMEVTVVFRIPKSLYDSPEIERLVSSSL